MQSSASPLYLIIILKNWYYCELICCVRQPSALFGCSVSFRGLGDTSWLGSSVFSVQYSGSPEVDLVWVILTHPMCLLCDPSGMPVGRKGIPVRHCEA